MLSPIFTMFKHFPVRAYGTVFIMVLISWYAFKQIRKQYEAGRLARGQGIAAWVLLTYILLLLFLAVLGRRSQDYDRHNFEAWYSYRDALIAGDMGMALQIAANILVFLPVGALMSMAAAKWKFLKGLLLGIGLSVCIETLQFVLRCGTVEVDDLISNTIGTVIGCGVIRIVRNRIRTTE